MCGAARPRRRLTTAGARARRVLLLPSTFFEEDDDSHVRLGFGRANLAQALAALDDFLGV